MNQQKSRNICCIGTGIYSYLTYNDNVNKTSKGTENV